MIKTSWAVILCKFNDDLTEPLSKNYYKNLLTSAGNGTQNIVEYFNDISHGKLDLSGNGVFGWYTLNKKRSDYTGSGGNPAGRVELVNWGRQAAQNNNIDLSQYFGVVICLNVATELTGSNGFAICDSTNSSAMFIAHEMSHGYGLLTHSRAEGSPEHYNDKWDIMSAANVFSGLHPRYGSIGPGMNAANMASLGWLDKSRSVERTTSIDTVEIELRPLHRHDLSGILAIEFGRYFIEFRLPERWDAAIPKPAVLIHRLDNSLSYILSDNSGNKDFVVGSEIVLADTMPGEVWNAMHIQVLAINASQRVAKIRLSNREYNWRNWFRIGQSQHNVPPGSVVTAIARKPEHIDLFVVGNHGEIMSTWWSPNEGWDSNHNWFRIGQSQHNVPPGSVVTAIARKPEHIDLFVVGNHGEIMSTWWSPNEGWDSNHNWFRIGQAQHNVPPGSVVTAIARKPEHIDLFVVGNHGEIMSTWWSP
jgi:hypothetical protein